MKRILLLLVFLITSGAFAGDQEAKTPATDEADVRAAADAYIVAYNRGDAKAVAQFWSERGEWVTPSGQRIQGREAIRKGLQLLFAENKGVQLELIESSIHFATPEVAVEEGSIRVTHPGQPATESTYIAIQVKQADGWKLDSVRETDLPDTAAPSPLQELDWLVGQWADTSPEAAITTTVSWTKNKSFLHYSFKVAAPGMDDLEGTQVIGWDPANDRIRSWMFDSDGGFAEGVWSRKDNRWMVRYKQTLPDGRKASATNVYTLVDNNTITWQSIGREVDGQFLPNVGPVTVVRKTTTEASKPADGSAKHKVKK